ncbi:cytochrome P450 [Micromonospora okii]|uniref:cytochrome P450 n=1 Tax=Micromonospora okii TaxID=1182970 RepID=UPI001E62C68A|nr:cytochrome P450 [Micromonospora okii]
MTDIRTTDAVAFPQDRTCPYQPPSGYRLLAEQRPISQVTLYDGRTAWAVTGHAMARRLLVDPRLSSDRTNPEWPMLTARVAAAATDVQKKVLKIATMLVGVDDPVHNARRRLLISSFTIRRINALRPRVQEIVDRQLDDMLGRDAPTDLIRAFASPVPMRVLCDLLGVPYDDHDFFERQSHQLLFGAHGNEAYDLLMAYLGALIERKRHNPGEGVLDDLIAEHGATGRVDSEELLQLMLVLLAAGHDTTTSMISLSVVALLEAPERLAELRADPSLMPAAVEELTRLLSIAEGMPRVATADIEVEGTTIRRGDGVLFMTSLINRDGDVHERPDSLDWHRQTVRDHVAFGFGVHQCIGQNVARATVEIAVRALIERLPGLRLAVPVQELPFRSGAGIQKLIELPVSW